MPDQQIGTSARIGVRQHESGFLLATLMLDQTPLQNAGPSNRHVFRAQQLMGRKDRVAREAQLRSHFPRGGKPRAGSQAPVVDGGAQCARELPIELALSIKLQEHDAMPLTCASVWNSGLGALGQVDHFADVSKMVLHRLTEWVRWAQVAAESGRMPTGSPPG
jgi:hypothetical protein